MKPWMKTALLLAAIAAPQSLLLLNQRAGTPNAVSGAPQASRATAASTQGAIDPRNVNGTAPGTLGGIFDGDSHPLSNSFSSLAAARAAYPGVWIPSLSCELDRCALQLAVNLAQQKQNYGKGINQNVYVLGCALIDFPILVTKGKVKIVGDGSQASFLAYSPLSNGGPLLYIGPPTPNYQSIQLGPSLVPGPGGSYLLNGGCDSWLNFSEIGSLSAIAGNSLTFEFWLQLSALPPANTRQQVLYLGGSLGALNPAGTIPFSFALSNNSIVVEATVANNYTLFQTSLGNLASLNKPHHCAAVLNNGTWTIYVDGAAQTVTAGTAKAGAGNLTIVPYLDFIIGQRPANYPDTGTLMNTVSGAIDSVRVSTSARYKANFTPPANKFTPPGDLRTYLICNFDGVGADPAAFLCAAYKQTSSLPTWVWQRYGPTGWSTAFDSVHGLNFTGRNGSAIVGVTCNNATLSDIQISGATNGLYFWRNTYFCTLRDFNVSTYNAGLVLCNQSVATIVDNATVNTGNGGIGIVSVGGPSSIKNVALQANAIGGLISCNGGSATRLENWFFDYENVTTQQALYFYDLLNVEAIGMNFLMSTVQTPVVTVDTCGYVAFRGCTFGAGAAADKRAIGVNKPGALGGPILVENCCMQQQITKWASDMKVIRTLP